MGSISSGTELNVSAHLSWVSPDSCSANAKLRGTAWPGEHEQSQCSYLSALLYYASTAVGTRGMVQPTRSTIPGHSFACWLGNFATLRTIYHLSNSDVPRR